MVIQRYLKLDEEEKKNEEQAEKDISRVLDMIEAGLPGQPPIYYIPGNHDPKRMILGEPLTSSNTTNVHNQWAELS